MKIFQKFLLIPFWSLRFYIVPSQNKSQLGMAPPIAGLSPQGRGINFDLNMNSCRGGGKKYVLCGGALLIFFSLFARIQK